MRMNKRYYIAYGSNLSQSQMAVRCPDARVVGTALLEGWQLLFKNFATIEQNPNKHTPVLVWEISESDERHLDFYEGFPRFYGKQELTVEVYPMDGSEPCGVTAMVYTMNQGHVLSVPSHDYYQVLRDGYTDFSFPQHVLSQALVDSIGAPNAIRFLEHYGFRDPEAHRVEPNDYWNVLDLDSGLYTGTFEDGRAVTILREKGRGFSVIRPTHNGWFEKADFDENGGLEGCSYEK
jgi:hypothetical protein